MVGKSKLYNKLYKADKECNTDRNSEVWLQKSNRDLEKGKKEAKGDITKLKDRNWCDNRQPQPGKIKKELVY